MVTGVSGCSMFTPKPEVVDTQAAVLGPIPETLTQAYGDALVLMQDEEFVAAEEKLLDITVKFPTYAGPWSNLSIAQSKQEKFDQALLSIDKSLLQDSEFCQAMSLKGIILRELGKFKLAKEQYLAALKCNPNDYLTLYNLGVLSDLYLHDNVTALSYYQQFLITQGEQQDETVKSWVVDLKRRVPAEVLEIPAQSINESADGNTLENQLAGEE
jgi:tetratricopeptide (TPR) repeat protein